MLDPSYVKQKGFAPKLLDGQQVIVSSSLGTESTGPCVLVASYWFSIIFHLMQEVHIDGIYHFKM